MFDLILATLFASAIGVVFKLSEKRVKERATLLLGNYIVAVAISTVMWVKSGAQPDLSSTSLAIALVAGAIFAGDFFLMALAIKKRGVALPVILMRLSAIVPIGASIAFFSESPSALQFSGLVAALCAAVILSVNVKGGEMTDAPKGNSALLVISSLGFLLCFGVADLCLKLFDEFGKTGEKPLFFMVLFSVALMVFAVEIIVRRIRPRVKDLLWGFALGVPNMLAAYFVVSALAKLQAFVVFPIVSASTVMLISLIAAVFFKEKMTRWGVFGVALTIAAIVAINLN